MTIYIEQIKEISHDNKYTKWYINIIENAQTRASSRKTANKILGYSEKHHIVPESFYINRKRKGTIGFLEGEPENKENFVYLSAKEHFIVHMLLPKMMTNENLKIKMFYALNLMINTNNNININAKLYERLKLNFLNNHNMKTDEARAKTSINMKNYYSTEEGLKFLAEKSETQKTSMIGDGNPAFGKKSGFADKNHTEEHINKMKSKTGNKNHRTGKSAYTKKYKITSPENNIIEIRNLHEFCKLNNIHYIKFYNSIKNNTELNGWKGVEIVEPKAILIDPIGTEHTVYNIKKFCKDNDLYYQCIIHVIGGIKPQHKGWTGYKTCRD